MSANDLKSEAVQAQEGCPLYTEYARIGQAMASPKRLQLINLLCQSEMPVDTLAAETAQSLASASAHLKVLKAAQLVDSDRRGKRVFYRLASDEVRNLWLSLRDLGPVIMPNVRELIRPTAEQASTVWQFDHDELLRRAEAGEVVILDVRPTREFEAGHVPGARSVPLDELQHRLRELPRDKPITVYCRGPHCVMAGTGVNFLRQQQFDALRLPLGVADWQREGRPLETISA